MAHKKIEYRIEKDGHGEMPVPVTAYWGIGTARALEFACNGELHPRFLQALAQVKKACAEANLQLGRVDAKIAKAVSLSAEEILSGQWHDQFPVSLLQAGSLFAVCTNIDEVLANRAGEVLGGQIGQFNQVKPAEHVSAGQTPYDTFPLALRLTLLSEKSELEACLLDLERLLRRKALALEKVIKPGRVHLQDALPLSLGQVFNSWGATVGRCYRRLLDVNSVLSEANPGAGEIGTGYGTASKFPALVVEKLTEISGVKLKLGDDAVRSNQSMSDYVALSSILKEIAIELLKISSDLRLMNSGPEAGFGEINLPTAHIYKTAVSLQDRSVPIVPEYTAMLCLQVTGYDLTICSAAREGQLECNAMLPLIAHSLLAALEALTGGIKLLSNRCISGVTADLSRCKHNLAVSGVERLLLSTVLGAEQASKIIAEAHELAISVRDLVLERQLMSAEQFEQCMNVKTLLAHETGGFAG